VTYGYAPAFQRYVGLLPQFPGLYGELGRGPVFTYP